MKKSGVKENKLFFYFGIAFVVFILMGVSGLFYFDDNITGNAFAFLSLTKKTSSSSSGGFLSSVFSKKVVTKTPLKAVETKDSKTSDLSIENKNIRFLDIKSNPSLLKSINPFVVDSKFAGSKASTPKDSILGAVCSDSDNGVDLDIKGATTISLEEKGNLLNSFPTVTKVDSCKTSKILVEHYCVKSTIRGQSVLTSKEYNCDLGCVDGACISPKKTIGQTCSQDGNYVYSYNTKTGINLVSECGPLGCNAATGKCNSCRTSSTCKNGIKETVYSGTSCRRSEVACGYGCADDGKNCDQCFESWFCDGKDIKRKFPQSNGACKTEVVETCKSAETCTLTRDFPGNPSAICLGPDCDEGVSCDGNFLTTKVRDPNTASCLVSKQYCYNGCSNNQCNEGNVCLLNAPTVSAPANLNFQDSSGELTFVKECENGCSQSASNGVTNCDCTPSVVCNGTSKRIVTNELCQETVENAPRGQYCSNGEWTSDECDEGFFCDNGRANSPDIVRYRNLTSQGTCETSFVTYCSGGICQNGQCLCDERYVCVAGLEIHTLSDCTQVRKNCPTGCDADSYKCKTCTPGWACKDGKKVYYQDTACTVAGWSVTDCVSGVCEEFETSWGKLAQCKATSCPYGLQLIDNDWGFQSVVGECQDEDTLFFGRVDNNGTCNVFTQNCVLVQGKCGLDPVNGSAMCF